MELINSIINIVKEAGKIITGAVLLSDEINNKEGSVNFVTVYDKKVENFLIYKLRNILPEAMFYGEETNDSSLIKTDKYYFIIDPIDGTTNFIHNMRHSAISVGLLYNNKIICGVIYNPYTEEIFYAEYEKGSYLNGERLYVYNKPLCESLVGFGTSPYKRKYANETFDMVSKLFFCSHDIRRSGSAALDLCNIACNRFGLFFEAELSLWDFAAASVIIEEAGGIIKSMDGNDLTYNKSSSILAANKQAYDDFIKL